jgi:kynurenine/2-aminoadipate aminotransferase
MSSGRRRIFSYDQYISKRSLLRRPSAIRELQPLLTIPGMISLGGGMPNKEMFPFQRITAELKDGTSIEIVTPETVDEALQYSQTPGIPRLLRHLEDIQSREHGRSSETTRICVTTGSQDALAKAFDMLLNDGDSLIIESPTYSGSLAYLEPMSCHLVGVETDQDGMIPSQLEDTLVYWDSRFPGKRKPKVLYTIPTGGNPTGATMPNNRKEEVYRICQRHDLLILEDDPYFYMQFNQSGRDSSRSTRTKSFFSMDSADGRVVRFDSLSKLLSSGIRIGFATGPAELIERLELHSQSTTLHTSGISQSLVASYFDHLESSNPGESGFYDGFIKHVNTISDFYLARRDVFLASAEKHLIGLCEWNTPSAGMFVWLKINGCENSRDLVKTKGLEAKVLFVPGESFYPCTSGPSPYVRAAYSTASYEDIDEAVRRFACLIKS